MAEFAVTVIGSGSSLPMHGRHPSAQDVQYDDIFWLLDCGEATQIRLRDAGIKNLNLKVVFSLQYEKVIYLRPHLRKGAMLTA